ncbi:hypothetical protein Acsp05_63990 [Actinokineospora sp. NBRC 105648]|nr:hypothetical protein Acsp05_63990 [Actinokineospora sp. NBRC 105648]
MVTAIGTTPSDTDSSMSRMNPTLTTRLGAAGMTARPSAPSKVTGNPDAAGVPAPEVETTGVLPLELQADSPTVSAPAADPAKNSLRDNGLRDISPMVNQHQHEASLSSTGPQAPPPLSRSRRLSPLAPRENPDPAGTAAERPTPLVRNRIPTPAGR